MSYTEKRNGLLCWACLCCGSFILVQYWNSERRRLLSNAGHLLPVKKLNSYHRLMFCSRLELLLTFYNWFIFFQMKCFRNQGLEDMVQEVGQEVGQHHFYETKHAKISLLGFVDGKMCWNSVINLSQLRQRLATAIRSVKQEILNNGWKNLKFRLHADFQECQVFIEH